LKSSPFFFLLIILLSIIYYNNPCVHASPTLTLTVTTDKPYYHLKENVTIYGNLTLNETSVTDGLVAIQVKDPSDETLMFRTQTTGTPPSATPYVKVRSIIPCDSTGAPKDSFQRGSWAFFKITVTNYDIEDWRALMTVSTYYPDNAPFGGYSLEVTLLGQTTQPFWESIWIPSDAPLGNATSYGNAYSGLPELGGWPFCTEASATFLITDGGALSSTTASKQSSQPSTTLQVNGNYNTTFKLSLSFSAGNYAIYVTSRYWAEEVFNTATFEVKLLGDINGDGKVDYLDDRIFGRAYIAYGQTGEYDPRCDFNDDGKIDYLDDRIFGKAYVEYGQTH
jgi:hypothetical protein